ncbi:IBR domain containing protein [Histomonas meleagridis]|uniref:IBR domain containing protein n=1 Tax=Histomonas meleagridis TaxID=135588 RepID=UPI0035595102|nr:IBR domain containing protein [Histomonas meleagridis]KAH0806838.1 IBR domain containing protein [Histomonas meleagridis]
MEGCKCLLPPNSVEFLCGKEAQQSLLKIIMNEQVCLADTLTNCPNPRCSRPINILHCKNICNVLTCACGYDFCAICKEASHAPATCREKERWMLLSNKDLMEQRLLGENCKKCPNCNAIIEKTGGCNQMLCKKCRHEFCWMCLKPWSTHPKTMYSCDAYKEEDDPYKKIGDGINPSFFEHYHDPFTRYQLTVRSYIEQKDDLIKSLKDNMVLDLSIPEDEYEQEATNLINQIIKGFENLKWSQVHMFSLRYQQVKDLDKEMQNNFEVVKPSSQYELMRFAHLTLQKVLNSVENRIKNAKSSRLTCSETMKMSRKIRLVRESLMKQADSHY